MSTDYYAGLAVGYRIPVRAVLKKTRVLVEEKSHVEARYDVRTGVRLEDVEVVDQEAGWYYQWAGTIYDVDLSDPEGEFSDMLGAIASEVGATYTTYGEDDRGVLAYVVFGLELPEREEADPHCHFNVGGSVLLGDLVRRRREYRALGRKLRQLGFRVGRCRVFVAADVSP